MASALLAVVPAAADAATYNLRPDGMIMTGWAATPAGTQQWDAVNDSVVAPALPSTTSDYLSSVNGTVSQNDFSLETAAIPAGENVTAAKAWVYAQTGTTRNLVVWVITGSGIVGTVTLPANSPAGWYQVPITAPLTQAQLDGLRIGFTHNGNSGTHTLIYATYVQVDVTDPAPPPPPPVDDPPVDPPADDPPVDPVPPTLDPPVVTPPSVDPPTVTPPTVDPPPVNPPTGTVVEPELAIAGKNPTATTAGDVPVSVACPPTSVDGCEGTLWLEEALDAGSANQGIRAARRSPKRFSRPKRYKLRQGQKQEVPIRLDRRTHRKFKNQRSFKVTVVAQEKGPSGQLVTERRTVRVFNPKPPKKKNRKKGK